jgi:hypothetical protein
MSKLLNKFKLLWGKGSEFVSEGVPAVVGENIGVAARLKFK